MQVFNVHEAKTHLSRLLEAVEEGGEVVIARAGQPVATLSPYRQARRSVLPPGSLAGQNWQMTDDFDAPLDELFNALSSRPSGDQGGYGA